MKYGPMASLAVENPDVAGMALNFRSPFTRRLPGAKQGAGPGRRTPP